MALNDVKELTVPVNGVNKAVKKIEDANGNIIWGSQTEYPYRRLEYIHFNGNEYLDTGVSTKSGYYRQFQFDLERTDVRQMIYGCYDGTVTDALRRYYAFEVQPVGSSEGTKACCGSIWTTAVASANIPLNTKLRISVVNSTVSSKPRMVVNMVNNETSAYIVNTTTINGTTNGSLSNVNAYLMGRHLITASEDSADNLTKGKVYWFIERLENYQGNLTKEMYPCQRKSDGVCGLYDVVNNTFHPMQGTVITSSAAGPLADEYWDLTSPA